MLLGGFDSEPTENSKIEFCKVCKLKNPTKGATRHKNSERPSCMDLILTNKSRSFYGCDIIEIGLSDFHKTIVTVMKMCFKK